MENEKISVKLEVFEGPLELLLHLLKKNKVSIYDIPIVKITEQYLSLIHIYLGFVILTLRWSPSAGTCNPAFYVL